MEPKPLSTGGPEFDFLDMADDDVMAMPHQPANMAAAAVEVVEEIVTPTSSSSAEGEIRGTTEGDGSSPPAPAGEVKADDDSVVPSVLDRADDEDISPPVVPAVVAPAKKDEVQGDKSAVDVPNADGKPAKADEAAPVAKVDEPKAITADDHKAFYDSLLSAPIKANGKEIQLQSPAEAVKLVQMGLNYTKKMQAMQPALRVVKMLENNGLMDESKLSHLIDLSKGDSGAIQKLLADTKFDPMSADAEQATNYVPADHRVTALEMSFESVLEEVQQTPTGLELISEVHGQWDADSKRALFEKPEILTKLAEQKTLGLYAQINGEVDRLRALGQITPDIPFLQAYHAVGDMLHQQGRLVGNQEVITPPVAVAPPAVPVETRVAAPTSTVKNTAQAQATAPVRTAPASTKPASLDYLSMDDAEFAKQTTGRF